MRYPWHYRHAQAKPRSSASSTWGTAAGVPGKDVLMYLSGSAENRDALSPVIGNGFPYTPY
jgi:hypothetical protein